MLAVEQRRPGALEVLPEQGPALDEGESAQILVVGLQEIEGIEARCTAPERRRSALKFGSPLEQCATASPSRTILVTGRAMTAA